MARNMQQRLHACFSQTRPRHPTAGGGANPKFRAREEKKRRCECAPVARGTAAVARVCGHSALP